MHTGIRALLKIGLLANLFEWYEFYVHASYSGADSSLCPLCRQLFHPPFRQFVLWFAGGSSGPPPFFEIIPDGDVCSYDSGWDAAHLRPDRWIGNRVSLDVNAGAGIWRRQ